MIIGDYRADNYIGDYTTLEVFRESQFVAPKKVVLTADGYLKILPVFFDPTLESAIHQSARFFGGVVRLCYDVCHRCFVPKVCWYKVKETLIKKGRSVMALSQQYIRCYDFNRGRRFDRKLR